MDADVRAVQPLSIGLVRCQPPALDDVGERVVNVVEIEVQTKRCRRCNGLVAIERHKLSIREQFQVSEVVPCLESLGVGQGRKASLLKLLERRRVLRPRPGDDNAVREPAVVGHELFYPTESLPSTGLRIGKGGAADETWSNVEG